MIPSLGGSGIMASHQWHYPMSFGNARYSFFYLGARCTQWKWLAELTRCYFAQLLRPKSRIREMTKHECFPLPFYNAVCTESKNGGLSFFGLVPFLHYVCDVFAGGMTQTLTGFIRLLNSCLWYCPGSESWITLEYPACESFSLNLNGWPLFILSNIL